MDTEDFILTIRLSDIQSINVFDVDVYDEFFADSDTDEEELDDGAPGIPTGSASGTTVGPVLEAG